MSANASSPLRFFEQGPTTPPAVDEPANSADKGKGRQQDFLDLSSLLAAHQISRTVSPLSPAPTPSPSPRPDAHDEHSWDGEDELADEEAIVLQAASDFSRLSVYGRRAFLTAVLPYFETSDLAQLSGLIAPLLKRDFIAELPQELGLHILGFVEDPKDLVRASRVSKTWRSLVLDEQTWKQMCERHRFGGATSSGPVSASLPGVLQLQTPPRVARTSATTPSRVTPTNRRGLTINTSTSTTPIIGLSAAEEDWALRGLGISQQTPRVRHFAQGQTSPFGTRAANGNLQSPISVQGFRLPSPMSRRPSANPAIRPRTPIDVPPAPRLRQHSEPDSPEVAMSRRPSMQRAASSSSSSSQRPVASSSRLRPERTSPVLADPWRPQAAALPHVESTRPIPLLRPLPVSPSRSRPRSMPGIGLTRPPANASELRQQGEPSFSASPPALVPVTVASPPAFHKEYPTPRTSASHLTTTAPTRSVSANFSRSSDPFNSQATTDKLSYKNQFKRAYLTESNWLRGPGRILSAQASSDDGVVTSLGFDDEWIVVGMATSLVHVFEAATGSYVRTLKSHTMGVWALVLVSKGGTREDAPSPDEEIPTYRSTSAAHVPMVDLGHGRPSNRGSRSYRTRPASLGSSKDFEGFVPHGAGTNGGMGLGAGGGTGTSAQQANICGTARGHGQSSALVVSGGCDRNVKVWDLATGLCKFSMEGHTSTIRCLKVLHGRPIAISGSRDATIRVWDIEQGRQIRLLEGHQHCVRCLEVSGNKMVSGSYDTTCRLWDIDTGECLHVFRGHFHQVYAVAFDGQRVASGSLDSTVRIWSARTGECLALLQGHTSLVGQLQLTDSVLVTGGSDGRVIVFSLATLECLHRLCAHDNSVTCLQFDDRFIVSGGNDGRVKLFDFKTGQFIRELAEPCEAVWRVTFRDDKCVILCKRNGKTTLSVLTFLPDEAEVMS